VVPLVLVVVLVLVIEIAEYGKPCEAGGVEDEYGYESPAGCAILKWLIKLMG
jgi:hypothetical protein